MGVFTLFGLAIPNFALGPLLILLFSIELGMLPVSGRGGPLYYIFPAATLGAALAAILTRMVRGSMLEEFSSDYVRTARAKGLSHGRSFVPPRFSQRADSHYYDSGIAVRHATGGNHCHRDDFLLAGHRPAYGTSDFFARLSVAAGCILVIPYPMWS